jgi:hypothetical protein
MSARPTRAPWDSEDGKPVYLMATPGGLLEAMAEEVRERQVTNARMLHTMSGGVLDELPDGSRFVVCELRAALEDLLRLLEG